MSWKRSADREQVIGVLKAAFVQGLLAKHEFGLRVGQTLASRTYAELAALTADLPAGLAAANRPGPGPPGRGVGGHLAVRPVGSQWPPRCMQARGHTSCSCPRTGAMTLDTPLIFGGFFMYLIVWICAPGEMLVSRREKRPGGQRPRE